MTKSVNEMRKELFNRTYKLEIESLEAKELQKELKGEYTYDKEFNPAGLDKDVVKKVMKAAQSKAKSDNLKEKAEELLAIDALIEELE